MKDKDLLLEPKNGFFIIYEAPDKLNSTDLMSCSSHKQSLDQNAINGTIQENLNSTNLMTLFNSTSPKLEENMKNFESILDALEGVEDLPPEDSTESVTGKRDEL